MGAQNVKLAYATWAGEVPPLSMQLLVYMALISKDADAEPWFGQGHEALAEHALGRSVPIEEKDVRAVERATAPLLKAGAIVADRRPAPRSGGPRTVRYRLVLRRGDAPRKPVDDDANGPRNPSGERPTVSAGDVPRNPAERPTESDETSHGNRGTEEKEEPGGDKRISQSARVREAVRWLRAEYGLTDSEAVTVWEIAESRAAEPVRYPARYLQSMRRDPDTGAIKGDLADIVVAVQGASGQLLAAVPAPDTQPKPGRPAPPVQPPILAAVQDAEDAGEIDVADAKARLRERLAEINQSRRREARAQAP